MLSCPHCLHHVLDIAKGSDEPRNSLLHFYLSTFYAGGSYVWEMVKRRNAAVSHAGWHAMWMYHTSNEAKVLCLIYSVGGADVGLKVGLLYTNKSPRVVGGGLCFMETGQHIFLVHSCVTDTVKRDNKKPIGRLCKQVIVTRSYILLFSNLLWL